MGAQDDVVEFDALVLRDEAGCLRVAICDVELLVDKAAILEIREVGGDAGAGAGVPVRLKVRLAGSIRGIEPADAPGGGEGPDPFAVCARALFPAPGPRGARFASPAYRAMAERFLAARGLLPEDPR